MKGLIVLFSFVATLASAGPVKTYPPTELDARYVVVEIEILSALEVSGRRYRVVQIDSRDILDQFSHELRFEGEKKPIGFKGFGSSSGALDLRKAGTAEWKTSESTMLVLSSIYSSSVPFEIRGIAGKPVAYRARVVKSCPVRIKQAQSKELRNTGSGVIAIPKIITTKYTAVVRPSCYEESDRIFEAGIVNTTEVPEDVASRVETARAESGLEETRRQRAIERERTSEGFQRDLRKQVGELAAKLTSPSGTGFEARLKQALCPTSFAKARVLGLRRIDFEKKLVESKQEKGYTRERYERTLTITRSNGEKDVYDSPSDLFDVFSIVGTLTVDQGRECFGIELRPNGGHSESKVLEEMERGFASLLDRQLRDEAYRKALAKIPEP